MGVGAGQEGVAVSGLQRLLLDGRPGQRLGAQSVQRAARVLLVLGHVAGQVRLLRAHTHLHAAASCSVPPPPLPPPPQHTQQFAYLEIHQFVFVLMVGGEDS